MEFSEATSTEIDLYTTGSCHVLALAIHEITGWKMLVILDDGEPHWIDPDDEDNYIASVCHVFCIDDNEMAWDIRGRRPLADVQNEMESWLHIQFYSEDTLASAAELIQIYVDDENDLEFDRPLAPYTDMELEDAKIIAQGLLNQFNTTPALK
jgi:hypothetical protein